MSILNYTTSIAPEKTALEIQTILRKHGASAITALYEGGKVLGVRFELRTDVGPRAFEVPVRTEGVLAELQRDPKLPRSKQTPEQAERVAWRIAKSWLETQLALVEAQLMRPDEVFLPYMLVGEQGLTVFEQYRQRAELESGGA
ncbi:MAG: hypothetical protein ACTH0V_00415 [Microbacteriaceae bacterium]